jgi:hypothetical protein
VDYLWIDWSHGYGFDEIRDTKRSFQGPISQKLLLQPTDTLGNKGIEFVL